ncbi:putative MFS transporter [Aspergillus alliaceus]|uniref:putative MFS transporter n=1 Tax=Petromyces alliaceus TaxID=209559 RepID=UPI0012A770EB|nr:major facilitator superfamily domain-containing protein [Aspergillus alliaceus]KAB8232071.1 major facilitator superfamily domain-containing protein [Aspergillus alliaceus]
MSNPEKPPLPDANDKPQTLHREYTLGHDGVKSPPKQSDYSGARKKTDPVEIRLVHKLDTWIMPTLWLMYWLNYLDRNAIALARLNDLEEDLGLSSSEYQTCVSILFVGYLLGQVPSNMLITRVKPSWYMSGCMALWAVVSAITALAKDFKGLLLVRFFLGVTEAPYYPGALYMLSIFYTRKEIATRISILYTGNILATAFAGLIAAGIFHGMDDLAGVTGWQWLFILQGAVTFLIAVLSIFTLPDDPLVTRWLTPEERTLAHERIVADTVGARLQTSTFSGLKEAASDPKLWLFAFMQHMHLAANGFKNFFPTAVETLGFSTTITLVLTCPPYLIAGLISVAWSWSSGRFNERTWHITVAKAIAIFGFVLGCATLNTGARYFAMVVFAIGTYAVNSIVLGWVSSTCGQTKEKKASSLAIVNTIANASFVWTPYLWPSSHEPRYTMAMTSSAAFSLACAASAWAMKIWLIRANRRIRQSNDESMLYYAY